MRLAAKGFAEKCFEREIAFRLLEKLWMTPTEPYAAKHVPLDHWALRYTCPHNCLTFIAAMWRSTNKAQCRMWMVGNFLATMMMWADKGRTV